MKTKRLHVLSVWSGLIADPRRPPQVFRKLTVTLSIQVQYRFMINRLQTCKPQLGIGQMSLAKRHIINVGMAKIVDDDLAQACYCPSRSFSLLRKTSSGTPSVSLIATSRSHALSNSVMVLASPIPIWGRWYKG
jgi:hypothetical protein